MADRLFEYHGMRIWDFENAISPGMIFAEILDRDSYGLKKINFKHGDVVLDVGANVGITSIWLARKNPGVLIYAFEPSTPNFVHLLKNVYENQVSNVIPMHMAITKDFRIIKITLEGDNTGGADIWEGRRKGYTNFAASITLDEMFRHVDKVKLLKMDVEGAEYEILPTFLNWEKVEHLSAEIHPGRFGLSPKDLEFLIRTKIKEPTLMFN